MSSEGSLKNSTNTFLKKKRILNKNSISHSDKDINLSKIKETFIDEIFYPSWNNYK